METKIDALIDGLILQGTLESAEVASILFAVRLALRDGHLTDLERLVWQYLDLRRAEGGAGTHRNGNANGSAAITFHDRDETEES